MNENPNRIIQVIEERVVIEKELVETGRVRVRKTIQEDTVSVNIPVTNVSYQVERVTVPIKTHETPPAAHRYEGETMIIPVVREITIVQKKYEVVEEIHIKKIVTQTPLTQEVTLMKEHVEIEREHNK